MPISFDLEQLRKDHNCSNFFETGLWDPTSNGASKQALASGFDKVFCIEIMEKWVDKGKQVFEKEIAEGRFHLFLDDSTNMIHYLNNDVFKNKTMFFLDAHVDAGDIRGFKKRCPLYEELEAIQSLERKDNVILVDDLRLIRGHMWGESTWGEKQENNINFLQEICNKILSINPDYNIVTLPGHTEHDVLFAYV
jgi:hypothetical protein